MMLAQRPHLDERARAVMIRRPLPSDGVGRALHAAYLPLRGADARFTALLAAIDRSSFNRLAG